MKKEPPSSRKVLRYARAGAPLDDGDDDDGERGEWLVRWQDAILLYPRTSKKSPRPFHTLPFSMEIVANTDNNVRKGYLDKRGCGHVLLGRNGSGKSLILQALLTGAGRKTSEADTAARAKNPYLLDESTFSLNLLSNVTKSKIGGTAAPSTPSDQRISVQSVSFDSHLELLQKGGSTYAAITEPNGGGQLTKAMKYFVVRFGLMPLLTQDVGTLSTGEIRKVLLIRALVQQPQLLLLDNAFDGLDVGSRNGLKDIIVKALDGFRSDILVQGVSYKDVVGRPNQPRMTQVLTVTHRPEEIVHQVSTVTFVRRPEEGVILTESRDGRSPRQLIVEGAGETPLELDLLTPEQFARADNLTGIQDEPWDDPTLPSEEEVKTLWTMMDANGKAKNSFQLGQELVCARDFCYKNGDKILLSELYWSLKHGQRWWISGLNGAGKSTLIQCLVSSCETSSSGAQPPPRSDGDESLWHVALDPADIGYISTNLHMSVTNSQKSCRHVLLTSQGKGKQNVPPAGIVNQLLKWLNIPKEQLARPFNELSQGEQRLLLIAGVFSVRPALLILDEPMQGLDAVNRHRVLGLLDRICCSTDVSLLYVTHHHEDLIPSLTHVLHLEAGRAQHNGSINVFDPFNTLWNRRLKPTADAAVGGEDKLGTSNSNSERKRSIFW
jgi:molybdate transport system ATP-binding protein